MKEVLAIGPDDIPDTPYFKEADSYPSFAPNLWLDVQNDLRPKMLAYWRGMEKLMRDIGQTLALSQKFDEAAFDDVLDSAQSSQLRLLYYPSLSKLAEPGQQSTGEHSDVRMMTILPNAPVLCGLQVKAPEGTWIDVTGIADMLSLNIGDLLVRWTNDRLISTSRRVAVPPLEARTHGGYRSGVLSVRDKTQWSSVCRCVTGLVIRPSMSRSVCMITGLNGLPRVATSRLRLRERLPE